MANTEWWPSLDDYNPGIKEEKWSELLSNNEIFNEQSMCMMRRMLNSGGQSSYKDALKVAKMILRQYGYSINNIGQNDKETFPFWTDMPRLYELYVYGELKRCFHEQVVFQVEGYYKSAADYILKDQAIILDAKYKPHYEYSNGGILDDIREMSGYARDKKILSNFKEPPAEVPCVIIYPTKIDEETDQFVESNLYENMDYIYNVVPLVFLYIFFYLYKIL